MPPRVRLGVEALSGLSMGDVRVHYGSSKPRRFGAHAFAEGRDIHLGPGHDGELAHEAWHVVQQKRGEVAPQLSLRDHAANVDSASEAEADRMGALAARRGRPSERAPVHRVARRAVLQLRMPAMDEKAIRANQNVAQELLMHRLRTIPDAEYEAMKQRAPDLKPRQIFLDTFEKQAGHRR